MKASRSAAVLLGVGLLGAGLALSGCHRTSLVAIGEVLEEKTLAAEGFSTPLSSRDSTREKFYTLKVQVYEDFPWEKDQKNYVLGIHTYTLNLKPTPERSLEFINSLVEKGSVVIFQYLKLSPLSSLPQRVCPVDRICEVLTDRIYVVKKEGDEELLENNLTKNILYQSCLTWPNECQRAKEAAGDFFYNL